MHGDRRGVRGRFLGSLAKALRSPGRARGLLRD